MALAGLSFSQAGPHFKVEPSGNYSVVSDGWSFIGSTGMPVTDIRTVESSSGVQSTQTHFRFGSYQAQVQTFPAKGVVVFELTYTETEGGSGKLFPDFTSLPRGLHHFSYRDQNFSPPTFRVNDTCTPWLSFSDRDRAYVFSPASNFMVAKLSGDGETSAACGLNSRVRSVPAGFQQRSVLVFAEGIDEAWKLWGGEMRSLFKKKTPGNTSDLLLRDFGYWTDNGADYYYNYDPALGYAGTLQALVNRYRDEGIPMGYLQLDSWWYDKSIDDANGKPGGTMKNDKLPKGDWNRYGGTMSYRADPDLFPQGLEAFQQAVDKKLAVHNRWIDRKSPYHDRYRFSGVAAIDPLWWNDVAQYLADSGVVCYEQDWLDHIYGYSPELSTVVGVGDAFVDGMASACKAHGLDMQYCMATPRFFLQGVKYDNLTTIRTSDDRFDRGKWHDFLYDSQFARAMGIWPWCDVFKSSETGNMILSVLSAGPVGTGDAMGKEDKDNIMRAALPDGTLVKPDEPLLPIDQTYIDEANGRKRPFVAATYSETASAKTIYLFAFPSSKDEPTATIPFAQCGMFVRSYLYNLDSGEGQYVNPGDTLMADIGESGYVRFELAPVLAHGIVVLGDLEKIAAMGRQRIGLRNRLGEVTLDVHQDAHGDPVTITGLAPRKPKMEVSTRAFKPILSYDEATHQFKIACPGAQQVWKSGASLGEWSVTLR